MERFSSLCLTCLFLHALSPQLDTDPLPWPVQPLQLPSLSLSPPPLSRKQGQSCGGRDGGVIRGWFPHLPASKWLCTETGGLWVPEAGGEGHPSRVQESSTFHSTKPFSCTQGGGAKVGCVRREELPPSWGWPHPAGTLPTRPGSPSNLVSSHTAAI